MDLKRVFITNICDAEYGNADVPVMVGFQEGFGMKTKTLGRPKRRTKVTAGDGMPDTITVGQLRSPTELQALHSQYRGQITEHDFFALACRALRKGKNPPAVFRWMLANRKAYQITIEEDSEARQMLRASYDSQPRCEWLREITAKVVQNLTLPKEKPLTHWEVLQQLAAVMEGER